MPESKPNTIKEYQAELDKLGIPYEKNAKLADLQALHEQSKIPFELVPNQMVKVITKDLEGNPIEGEKALDLLMGSDEVILKLQDEKSILQDSLKTANNHIAALKYDIELGDNNIIELTGKLKVADQCFDLMKSEQSDLKDQIAVRDTEIATLKDEKAVLESRVAEIEKGLLENLNNPKDYLATVNKTVEEKPSYGTGDNVVNVSTVINLQQRMREGFVFTRKTTTYYLTDEELEAVKKDAHLVIHGEVTKREAE